MTETPLPRGIRNNNPGNIRLSSARWQGQKTAQLDPSFVEFATPVMGLRALMRVLLTYYLKFGLDTVESIINRWAPPHENATDHYIHHVARRLGVKRRQRINVTDKAILTGLAVAIARHENGAPPAEQPEGWYTQKTYDDAADKALATLASA